MTDLVWNLDEIPWPLPANHFQRILLIDVLEHLADVVAVMEEVYRVARPDALVEVQAPFASSRHVWTDPTHRRGFTSTSFKYFDEAFCRDHFSYTSARFALREVDYLMWAPRWYDKILLRWANRHKALYEKRFLYWYPVENIRFVLRTLKTDGC